MDDINKKNNKFKNDEIKEFQAILFWKLGLGNMEKYFAGENPMPDKSIIADSTSWKTEPMPSNEVSVLDVNISISKKDMDVIRRGHMPESQADHWFMYCTEKHICYYRSWTGACAFKAHYVKVEDESVLIDKLMINYALSEFGVNGDKSGLALFLYLLTAETGVDARREWNDYLEARKELFLEYQCKKQSIIVVDNEENERIDKIDGTFARRLVDDFIKERLDGDIKKLVDFDFSILEDDKKYGMSDGLSCGIEKCDIILAIMSLVFEDVWPDLSVDSMKHYTYNCTYINKMQYLFGSNISDKYFMSMRNFGPTKQQVDFAVQTSHLQNHIGNFWVLPKFIDKDKETYNYHGCSDLWLQALYAAMSNAKVVDNNLKANLYEARIQMSDYHGAEGFDKLVRGLMLNDYIDDDGKPKNVLPHIWANMKGLSRDDYFEAVDIYNTWMRNFINARSNMMVSKLEQVLSETNKAQQRYVKKMLEEENNNEYSKIGSKFVETVEKMVADNYAINEAALLDLFDKISRVPSRVYDDKITINDVIVERSAMGAWQAYLYSRIPNIMSLYNDECRSERHFVFKHNDLKDIEILSINAEKPLYGVKFELSPKVKIRANEAKIQVCYWNNREGLIRDTVAVYFSYDYITEIKCVKSELLLAIIDK